MTASCSKRALAALLCAWLAPPAAAQPASTPAAVRDGQGTVYARGQYVGPGPCAAANCHGNPEPSRVYDVPQNEFSVWFHSDRHRRAAEALFDERSQLIARNLRLAQPAHRSARCLDCHSLNPARRVQAVPLELADGISCESCHGPAGGWLARHNEAGWTRGDSVAGGMTDLGDLRARARLCLGCHQGEPGRQVDHEMLAAGHPELVFELDNYTESLPPHWLPFAERRSAAPADRRDTHGLAAWAVGQAEAFRQGLRLLGHRASSETWPEFAELACDTCHHDLSTGRWRQLRGYRQRAGLPSWSPARWAVLRHLVAAAAPDERAALDADIERLAAQVARLNTPPERLAASCAETAERLERVLPRLASAAVGPKAAADLLGALARDRDYLEAADRASAEQAALALQSLLAHLETRQPALRRGPLPARMRALFAELDDPYRFDRQRFSALLAELEMELE
jgi:hypothetical protein